MTNEEALAALAAWGKMVLGLQAPLGPILALSIAIAEDALRIESTIANANAQSMLTQLRQTLRQSIAAEWQQKLDSQFPQTD
jgi:hypothetical protein